MYYDLHFPRPKNSLPNRFVCTVPQDFPFGFTQDKYYDIWNLFLYSSVSGFSIFVISGNNACIPHKFVERIIKIKEEFQQSFKGSITKGKNVYIR